eukprot:SAG31_NODE_33_length_32018_cov_69.763088_13_plen_81_part_00
MVIVSAGLTDVIFELMHHSLAEEVQPQYSLSDSVSRAPISVVSNKMIFRQLEKVVMRKQPSVLPPIRFLAFVLYLLHLPC